MLPVNQSAPQAKEKEPVAIAIFINFVSQLSKNDK